MYSAAAVLVVQFLK